MNLSAEDRRILVASIILHGIITDRTPTPSWTIDDGIGEAIHVTDKLLFTLEQMPVGMSEVSRATVHKEDTSPKIEIAPVTPPNLTPYGNGEQSQGENPQQ